MNRSAKGAIVVKSERRGVLVLTSPRRPPAPRGLCRCTTPLRGRGRGEVASRSEAGGGVGERRRAGAYHFRAPVLASTLAASPPPAAVAKPLAATSPLKGEVKDRRAALAGVFRSA